MADVLLARNSDSKGYTRLTLADPVGSGSAGEVVEIEVKGQDQPSTIMLHGQREFDIPADATKVTFPDDTSYTPKK